MQFTLKRLLAVTALIAFGLAGATLPWRGIDLSSYPWIIQTAPQIHFWSSGFVIGCGIGLLFKHAFVGAALGFVASWFLAGILLMMATRVS